MKYTHGAKLACIQTVQAYTYTGNGELINTGYGELNDDGLSVCQLLIGKWIL